MFKTEIVRAVSVAGLRTEDKDGNLILFLADGGRVLGLGTSLVSPWAAGNRAYEMWSGALAGGDSGTVLSLAANLYFSVDWKYAHDGEAAYFAVGPSGLYYWTAPAGVKDASAVATYGLTFEPGAAPVLSVAGGAGGADRNFVFKFASDGSWSWNEAADLLTLNKPLAITGVGTLAGMAAIADAPIDGSTYGRKDGAWAVAGGGPGGTDPPTLTNVITTAITIPVNGSVYFPYSLTLAAGGSIKVSAGSILKVG